MAMKNLEGIEWTLDCQGKQDFDADLVRLSTRYYPRGGGFSIITRDGRIEENEARPEIKPLACTSIYYRDEQLARAEFEGETEGEVKLQVEAWASDQLHRIEKAIRALYQEEKAVLE